jgi:hypothetical protein
MFAVNYYEPYLHILPLFYFFGDEHCWKLRGLRRAGRILPPPRKTTVEEEEEGIKVVRKVLFVGFGPSSRR